MTSVWSRGATPSITAQKYQTSRSHYKIQIISTPKFWLFFALGLNGQLWQKSMLSASDAETRLFFAIVASGLKQVWQEKAICHKHQEIIVILIIALYIELITIY